MKLNCIKNIFGDNIETSKIKSQKIKYNGINPITNLDSDPKAFLGISLIKIPAWKKLRPKIFSTVTPKKYSPSVKRKTPVCYKYIQKGKEIGEQKFHCLLNGFTTLKSSC